MTGANRPQDHHCTRDSSAVLPKSCLTVISGSMATTATADQKQAPSAIDLAQEPWVGPGIARSVLITACSIGPVGEPDFTRLSPGRPHLL